MTFRSKQSARRAGQRGFSTIELLMVVLVGAIVASFAIPQYLSIRRNLRISGDIHSVAGDISVAKMRSAADFTYSRVFLYAGPNPYHRVDVWNKTFNCWVPDGKFPIVGGDCITSSTPTNYEANLSPEVTPGFGGAAIPPEGALAQSPACTFGGTTALNGLSAIANTSCIVFNSRGFPVDAAGSPAAGSFYITDGNRVYAVTLNAMGLAHTWNYNGYTWKH